MGLAHPEGQAGIEKGAGQGRAGWGRAGRGGAGKPTTRTPSNITKTEFCLVRRQGSGSGARGQALCTLLVVGGPSQGNGLHPATTATAWKAAGSSFLYYLLERTLGLLRKGQEQWSLMSYTSSHPRRHSQGHHDLALLECQAGGEGEGQSVEREDVIKSLTTWPLGFNPNTFITCSSCLKNKSM